MSNFTQEELLILEGLKIAPEEVTSFTSLHGEMSFVSAVGGLIILKRGEGQVRNEQFTPQSAPTTGSEETNGVKSASVEEFNAMSEEEKKEFTA